MNKGLATAELLRHLPHAAQPLPDVFTSARLDAQDLAEAQRCGIQTIVCVCPEGESADFDERATVLGLGMSYVNIPLASPDDLTRDNAERLAEVLNNAQCRPALVHCLTGNRAGALLALKGFYVDDMPQAQAIALGRSAGLKWLEPTVQRLIAEAAAAQEMHR